ncbi:hypothetical protein AAFF_G00027420 [Aldrovandia affinis]|uniref:Uncharacterized protein n=1 Tax=Aldrovandia affinis TaxID=143900 RepID=A0AAD7S4P5_9TELE|nr:hypothetical protein AAFF_G00027420 [Aldrovandia affinis]
MSGVYRGLQARIRTHNEKALYAHCKTHCLNLVLVESSKSSVHFVIFFNLLEKLYVFYALQQKDLDHSTAYKVIDKVLDTLKTNRYEEEFKTIFENASEKAESLDIPIPTVVPGQGRKRKIPVHFQHSTTPAKVSHQLKSVEEYYWIKVYYTFLDTMTQELHRRFKGDDDRMPTDRIIQSFHSLTIPANWCRMRSTNPEGWKTQPSNCFTYTYGVEDEEKLK